MSLATTVCFFGLNQSIKVTEAEDNWIVCAPLWFKTHEEKAECEPQYSLYFILFGSQSKKNCLSLKPIPLPMFLQLV